MSLTEAEFNRLSTCEQFALLEDEGIYLSVSRVQTIYKIALFSLYGYYVEVWLNRKTDKLVKAFAFSSYSRLDPFLEGINLTSLYSLI
jgi:hypothetical protein